MNALGPRITPFVVSKCANFEVKLFPNTHFFSKKHEFWRIYQCTDLVYKLRTVILLLSQSTYRDVLNAIFKSFLRHIESILCLFKVTNKIQKKIIFFFFYFFVYFWIFSKECVFHVKSSFSFKLHLKPQTSISNIFFFMVFGANESWGFVLLGFPILVSNGPLVQILGAGKCAIFFEKMTFQKKIKKWRIYARIESDHFFDFIFEKSDLFYIYDDLGTCW